MRTNRAAHTPVVPSAEDGAEFRASRQRNPLRREPHHNRAKTVSDPFVSRRAFLQLAGGATIGLVAITTMGCEFNSVEPITTGADVDFVTPIAEFYYKNGAEGSIANWTQPVIDRTAWRLRIDGLVATPLEITYADIVAETSHAIDLLKTMRCVIDSNEVQGLIGTAVWRGVPLRLFLERAGVDRTRAVRLRLHGSDGFTNNVKIDRVFGTGDADLVEPLLVTHMNGELLPEKHGFPVRLMIHESFGYKNVKWITRVEATDSDAPFGTYQSTGFIDDGVMRVVSRTTDPIDNLALAAGRIRCVGFAVSGAQGIDRIEISVDNGPFQTAAIVPRNEVIGASGQAAGAIQMIDDATHIYPWRGVWAKWIFEFDATPGRHTIRFRAADRAGNIQPDRDTDISDGINAVGSITITCT